MKGAKSKVSTKDPFAFMLRMPLSLRNKLVTEAGREGLTLNLYLVKVLTEHMEKIETKRINDMEHYAKVFSLLVQEEW